MSKRLTPEVVTAASPARSGSPQLAAIETGLARLTELHSSFAPGNDTSASMIAVTQAMLDAMNELADQHGEDPALMAKRRRIQQLSLAYGKQVFQIGQYTRQLASDEEGFKTLRKKMIRVVEQIRLSAQRFGEFIDSRPNLRTELGQLKAYVDELLVLDPRAEFAASALTKACDAMLLTLDASLEPFTQQVATLPAVNANKERLYRALEALQTSLLCLGSGSNTIDGLILRKPILAKLTALMGEVSNIRGPLNDPAGIVATLREIEADVMALRDVPAKPEGHPFSTINLTLPLIRTQVAAAVALAEGSPQAPQRALIPIVSPRQVSGTVGATWV